MMNGLIIGTRPMEKKKRKSNEFLNGAKVMDKEF